MKKKVDLDMPVGRVKTVKDFLPPPSQLVFPNETVKVTIALSKPTVEFFKKQAKQHHTKYQRMIRQVIDKYAQQYARH